MQTFPKKRLEIVIETPARRGLLALLEQLGVTGYTVLDAAAGSGRHGAWDEAGQVSSAQGMALVICIVDPAGADRALEAISAYIEARIAIVTISDVEVLRGERF